MRSLSPEEEELWARVSASIRPLSREKQLADNKQEISVNETPRKIRGRVRPARTLESSARATSFAQTLDGNWDRRLRSGDVNPDRVLDLHGHSLDRAWAAIDQTLERAILSGDRVILLITGHARPGEPPVERGRIRAAVHDWLTVSRHARKIAAVRNAHRRHGGGGSLYIILRRR